MYEIVDENYIQYFDLFNIRNELLFDINGVFYYLIKDYSMLYYF